ncbi:Plasmid partition protein ParA-like protein, partial [Pseudomonas syringae pv. actinidiae ICMP 18886]
GIEPIIRVETFGTFSQALKASSSDDVDLLIFDGGPQATAGTVDMGKSVDLMILPTGLSLDDLTPTVRLANR